jgi:hypothetical protein
VCGYDEFLSFPHTRNTNIVIKLIRQSKLYMQPPSKQIPRIVIVTLDSSQLLYIVYFIVNYKHFNVLNLWSFIMLMIFVSLSK